VIPAGTSPENRITLTLEAGYIQGALYKYAATAGIIHCPGDARVKLKAGKGFTYVSLSAVGTLNGEVAELYKTTEIQSPSERFLWIEENDPRGDNLGSWIMNGGTPARGFTDASIIDSTSVFHGNSSTFNFADGHSALHKWIDPAMIKYGLSEDQNKYANAPTYSTAPHDVVWLGQGYVTKKNP
jgi:prepilin-type processing-associated H-X9-DG protein